MFDVFIMSYTVIEPMYARSGRRIFGDVGAKWTLDINGSGVVARFHRDVSIPITAQYNDRTHFPRERDHHLHSDFPLFLTPSPLRHPNPHPIIKNQTLPLPPPLTPDIDILPLHLPNPLLRTRNFHRTPTPHLRILDPLVDKTSPSILPAIRIIDFFSERGDSVGEAGFVAPGSGSLELFSATVVFE